MLGPEVVTAGLRARREREASVSWVDEPERQAGEACDLCESEGLTSERYGLDVCSLCAETLLP